MATFAFSGRTRSGETINGERIGDTMDAVVAALRREQIQVTKITPAQAKAGAGVPSPDRITLLRDADGDGKDQDANDEVRQQSAFNRRTPPSVLPPARG